MRLKVSGKAFIIIFMGAAFLSLIVSNALAASVNYIYDDLNRLKEVDYPDGTIIKYEYDKLGNRTRMETSGNPGNFITATAGINGTISPSGVVEVNYGASQSFTLTPSTGYHVATVTGCGGTLSGTTYITGTISGFCTVSATFAIDTFNVTPSPGANGSMSPGTPQNVNYGSTTVFTITPNAGYLIASVRKALGKLWGRCYLRCVMLDRSHLLC